MRAPTAANPPSSTLQAKALLVNDRLCEEYGAPIPFFHDLDPLSELVSSLLSHRTRNADSGRAFKQLRTQFADWPSVRDAPTADIQAASPRAPGPNRKPPGSRPSSAPSPSEGASFPSTSWARCR